MKRSTTIVVTAVITALLVVILFLGISILRSLSANKKIKESVKIQQYIEQMSQAREEEVAEKESEADSTPVIVEHTQEIIKPTDSLVHETKEEFRNTYEKGNLTLRDTFDLSAPNGAWASTVLNVYAEEHNLTDGLLEGTSFEDHDTYVVVLLRYNGVDDVYTYEIPMPED